jgi:pimeloyl-ACP methyl ester carboxylesterase
MNDYQKLFYSNQEHFLAYRQLKVKSNNKYGIIFLGGFKSDMNGTKAQAIAAYSQKKGYDLLTFDYFGHGYSSGEFTDGTIGMWLENALLVIDQLTKDKPQILIGSSMGGWLMLLAALARPEKIAGLIGLAAAPDFTEDLIWEDLTIEQKEKLLKTKLIELDTCDHPFPISLELITEARKHLLLRKEIPLNMPIRLIQGMDDKDVPYSTAIKLAEQLTSKDLQIHLLKNAEHRLSQPQELEFICKTLDDLL